MTALLREVRWSGRRSRQAGGCYGGLQKHLIGPVPPPLCRWMADRLPAHDPLLPLHGPLREDEIPSERRRQRRAARGQIPTALGAAPGPTDPAGSGRICPLRTDHLGEVEADRGDLLLHFGCSPCWWSFHHFHAGTSVPQREASIPSERALVRDRLQR